MRQKKRRMNWLARAEEGRGIRVEWSEWRLRPEGSGSEGPGTMGGEAARQAMTRMEKG